LKNEQQVFKMELDKQKAAASGLVVPTQDPKPQDSKKPVTQWTDIPTVLIPQALNPSTGKDITELSTTPNVDTNYSRALFDALDIRKKQLIQEGRIPNAPSNEASKQYDLIQQELQKTLARLDDKSLDYSPLGQPGQLLGGLLDVVSGPLDLGTMIFGAQMNPAHKAQLLIQAANSVSPIVRAGLQDALGRDRLDQNAEIYLSRIGMGRLKNRLGNENDLGSADVMMKTGIDINTLLATAAETQMHFGSEASTTLGDAFRAYQNTVSAASQLPNASIEDMAKIEADLQAADATMRMHVKKYFENGGTPESFSQALASAQQVINSKYQQPLTYTPGDYRETQFKALQSNVADEFTRQLSEFETIVSGDLPLLKDQIKKAAMGDKTYERMKQVEKVPFDIKVNEYTKGSNKHSPGGYGKPRVITPEEYAIIETGFSNGELSDKAKSVLSKLHLDEKSASNLIKAVQSAHPNEKQKVKTALDRSIVKKVF